MIDVVLLKDHTWPTACATVTECTQSGQSNNAVKLLTQEAKDHTWPTGCAKVTECTQSGQSNNAVKLLQEADLQPTGGV